MLQSELRCPFRRLASEFLILSRAVFKYPAAFNISLSCTLQHSLFWILRGSTLVQVKFAPGSSAVRPHRAEIWNTSKYTCVRIGLRVRILRFNRWNLKYDSMSLRLERERAKVNVWNRACVWRKDIDYGLGGVNCVCSRIRTRKRFCRGHILSIESIQHNWTLSNCQASERSSAFGNWGFSSRLSWRPTP